MEETISACITEEMNDLLRCIPEEEEVKTSVFAIHADKASGSDGFSASFYQSFWSMLGPDIYRVIRTFFTSGSMPSQLTETHICLIPKTTAPKTAAEYRPIALCNVQYKIFAKILTSRLQQFLLKLISQNQTAFVPGRAISENVLITHKTLHYLETSEASKRCSMVIKTDMSKAYDRIEWGFLEEVMKRMGFRNIWIGWIMECVTSLTYSFMINGAPLGKVRASRGLRQADPLCTEVLSGLCKNAQEKGRLLGLLLRSKSVTTESMSEST